MTDIRIVPDGWLILPGLRFPCALGRSGIARDKREGDGATPAGRWQLRDLLYRPDRMAKPRSPLESTPMHPDWGWCDDSAHPDYNRRVRLPHPARCEQLWRDDALYDLILVLGYNDDPVIAGRGSAIFLHVARPGLPPTEGCVALGLGDLAGVLERSDPGDVAAIEAPDGGSK
jgi:L,D-peptidoglycan transpeptidase YkuD (ErfK/YbiS/YcfS/YnhG family)